MGMRWLKDNILNLISIIPWVVAAVIALLAWLQHIPWYLIVLGIIVAVAATFWGINQIGIFQKRQNQVFLGKNNEKMESLLRKWLDKRHYPTQHKTNDKYLFYFVARDTQQRPIHIMRPQSNSAVIRLLLVQGEKELERFSTKRQEILRSNIGIEMARFGLRYHEGVPMYVYLDMPCDDSLTENTFMNAIDRIRQAHVLMSAHIQAISTKIKSQPKTRKVKKVARLTSRK
jgi:hypothetical protein